MNASANKKALINHTKLVSCLKCKEEKKGQTLLGGDLVIVKPQFMRTNYS